MASGVLGSAVLTAGQETVLCVFPAGQVTTFNLYLLNPGALRSRVKVAIGKGTTADPKDYIENGFKLGRNGGTLERTGLIGSPGEKLFVTSEQSGVVVRANGFEEPQ